VVTRSVARKSIRRAIAPLRLPPRTLTAFAHAPRATRASTVLPTDPKSSDILLSSATPALTRHRLHRHPTSRTRPPADPSSLSAVTQQHRSMRRRDSMHLHRSRPCPLRPLEHTSKASSRPISSPNPRPMAITHPVTFRSRPRHQLSLSSPSTRDGLREHMFLNHRPCTRVTVDVTRTSIPQPPSLSLLGATCRRLCLNLRRTTGPRCLPCRYRRSFHLLLPCRPSRHRPSPFLLRL
jgi:hypothetical protein